MEIEHITPEHVCKEKIKEILELLDKIIEKYDGCDLCKTIG